MELLDTEHEPMEDPVEVERWSEYVEKYVNNEESITDGLRTALARKPVFLPRNVRNWRKRNETKPSFDLCEETGQGDSAVSPPECKGGGESDSKDDSGENKENEVKGKLDVKQETASPETGLDGHCGKDLKPPCDVDIIDNTECKFNVNSFKLVYVVNSESYLYKRMALQRARQSHKSVSLRLHEKFKDWLENWKKENVTGDMEETCVEWLLGENEGNKPCVTSERIIDAVTRPPYYRYKKYRVQMQKDSDAEQD